MMFYLLHRMRGWFLVAMALVLLMSTASDAQTTQTTQPAVSLDSLVATHPRLLISDAQLARVKEQTKTDPGAAALLAKVRAQGEKMLTAPTAQYRLIGPRLLDQSRYALRVISTTAGLYRLTGDVRFADRARTEMLAVCAFKDWHPPHFLDVAEMTNGVALGYDWIYDRLSDEDRQTIAKSIAEKGLKPGLHEFARHAPWTSATHNWAQVCSGGLTAGALAIADVQPDLAREILTKTRHTMQAPMSRFAPDGGWDEGPGYWGYATEYTAYYLSDVETALGTDFGFFKQPGFAQTGNFPIFMMGPTGQVFNFADCSPAGALAPQMFYFAQQFNRPDFAAWERQHHFRDLNIMHLLWWSAAVNDSNATPATLGTLFRRSNVVSFRSAWNDKQAWFVGFKGGDNTANHAHLDLGTFVLDAQGKRWAEQLGSDDYNLPDYFGKLRYTYYRLRTEGQNTLTIDEANQNEKAKSPIVATCFQPDRMSAIADLTAGYPQVAQSVRRGVALLDRSMFVVQDELDLVRPAKVVWNFHTPAAVTVDGKTALLTQGSAKLRATILSPADAIFSTRSATPPAPQAPNKGVTNLVIEIAAPAGKSTIAVAITGAGDEGKPEITPLQSWPADSQVP